VKSRHLAERYRFDLIGVAIIAQIVWIIFMVNYVFVIASESWVIFSSISGYIITFGEIYLFTLCEVTIIYILVAGLKGRPLLPFSMQ
jgi:hypothetical protein